MTTFNIHNNQTAPKGAIALLNNVEKSLGFVPNLVGIMAEAPAVAEAYMSLMQLFDITSFTATERQVAILAVSRFNECHYCVAAHSVIAEMQNVPIEVVEAIRNDEIIADPKLEALRAFTTLVVNNRGWVNENDVEKFINSGYTKAQMLEVVLAVSFKTLSNYVNHITNTPLDEAFSGKAWKPTNDAKSNVA